MVKTVDFHSAIAGSNPAGVTKWADGGTGIHIALKPLLRKVEGSNPSLPTIKIILKEIYT